MTRTRPWPRSLLRADRPVWGVRKRATATAVVVVTAALLVGGLLLLVLLQTSLIAATETAAKRKAIDVAAQITSQDVSETGRSLATTAHSGQYVQIISPSGAVVASSGTSASVRSLSELRPGAGQTLIQDVSSLHSIGDNDSFLSVATGVPRAGGVYTVVVAATAQVQADTVPRWLGSCSGPRQCCWGWLASRYGFWWAGHCARSRRSADRLPASMPPD